MIGSERSGRRPLERAEAAVRFIFFRGMSDSFGRSARMDMTWFPRFRRVLGRLQHNVGNSRHTCRVHLSKQLGVGDLQRIALVGLTVFEIRHSSGERSFGVRIGGHDHELTPARLQHHKLALAVICATRLGTVVFCHIVVLHAHLLCVL